MPPTQAEIQNQIGLAVELFEQIRLAADPLSDPDAFRSTQDALTQAMETEQADRVLAGLSAVRGNLSASLTAGAFRAVVDPLIRQYASLVTSNAPDPSTARQLARLYRHFIDTGQRVRSRDIAYGNPTLDSPNAGNGTIYRLTTDEEGFDIEAEHVERKVLTVVQDANTGARLHNELFEVRGAQASADALGISGSGLITNLKALSASDSLMGNTSFSIFGGSNPAAPTSITDWTVGGGAAIGNFEIDQANVYRSVDSDTTPGAVKFKATGNLSQRLTVRRRTLTATTPYLLHVAYNATTGSPVGTLTIRMGAASASVAISGSGWRTLLIQGTLNNWLENFNEQNLDIVVEWARTSGDLLVDDLIFAPYTQIDGTWWAAIGGATPWLRKDEFTATDTEIGARINYWFWRAYGFYFPHATTGITWVQAA